MRIKELDVLIQGAGIGGLSLAIALQKQGLRVSLLEKAPSLSEVGAGIWMAPNAMQILDRLGLASPIQNQGWPNRRVQLLTHQGKVLQNSNLGKIAKPFGFDTIAIHRGRLQKILAEALGVEQIIFEDEIEEWQETAESLLIRSKKGRDFSARLIVGADGLHSSMREKIFPHWRKRYSGSSSYRAVITCDQQLLSDPYSGAEIWGPGCRIGFTRISAAEIYWYMTFEATEAEKRAPKQDLEHARQLFHTHFPQYQILGRLCTAEALIRTDIKDLQTLPTWFKDRLVLIGDAAHATTPNLGQGGAQAIEDAWVLAHSIKLHGLQSKSLDLFYKSRRTKAQWIVENSWRIGRICHIQNPLLCGLRNTLMKYLPSSLGEKQFTYIYRVNDLTA